MSALEVGDKVVLVKDVQWHIFPGSRVSQRIQQGRTGVIVQLPKPGGLFYQLKLDDEREVSVMESEVEPV